MEETSYDKMSLEDLDATARKFHEAMDRIRIELKKVNACREAAMAAKEVLKKFNQMSPLEKQGMAQLLTNAGAIPSGEALGKM